MLELIIVFTSNYLIETMAVMLLIGLIFRFKAYRSSRVDQVFFSSFTRAVEKKMHLDSMDKIHIENPEEYINEMINQVEMSLPKRSVRFGKSRDSVPKSSDTENSDQAETVSLREYTSGGNSLIHSLRDESNVFASHHPPNFWDLTSRMMNRDEHWVKLFGFFKIDSVSRMIDALPGIFIVMGIFGTFVGVSRALPQIAQIDFSSLDESSTVLSAFVLEVTFAMKTSIAGIICSLVMGVLNALSPIGIVRRQIAGQVEHVLERLWFFVQGDPDQQKLVLFREMVSNLKRVTEGLEANRKIFSGVAEELSHNRKAA